MTTTINTDKLTRHGVEIDVSDETGESGMTSHHVSVSHFDLGVFASFRRTGLTKDSVVLSVHEADEVGLNEHRGNVMFSMRNDGQIIHVHLPVTPDDLMKMLVELYGDKFMQSA